MIQDPGKNKNRSSAKTGRLKAWKKPSRQSDVDALRAGRIAEWEKRNGSSIH
jgi:hypothetical protein